MKLRILMLGLLFSLNTLQAAPIPSNETGPGIGGDPQIYGTYQYLFTITVSAPLDGVVGKQQTYGTYYAACPPGSDAYYTPGYQGPFNLTAQDAISWASKCGFRGQCGTNLNIRPDGYGRVKSTASCSAKTTGWLATSVVKSAAQSGTSGYFGFPVISGFHYEIQATSLWRHVVPTQSVVIPGFDMNPDLNSVYVQSPLN